MKYLKDHATAAETIAGLRLNIDQAEYELAAALSVAKQLGLTWAELGEAMGLTKQGASQFAKRKLGLGADQLDDDEYERICRQLGAGDRQPRYEVRRVVSGRPGVSAVSRELVSRHRKLDTAEARWRVTVGQAEHAWQVELWEVTPHGERVIVARRPGSVEPAEFDDGAF